jgi:hypothetical protein
MGDPAIQLRDLRHGERDARLIGHHAIEDLLGQRDAIRDRHAIDAELLK